MTHQTWFECYSLDPVGLEYAARHRDLYRAMAEHMAPNLSDSTQVWDRIAFAILSANCRFEASVAGLQYARQHRGRVMGHTLAHVGGGMTQVKAGWLNALPPILGLLKAKGEEWNNYRARLARVRGLGITKASFAACLLYPFESEVCCLDVWMLRGLAEPIPHRLTAYQRIETRVQAYATQIDLPLFLTQWALWDWVRGRIEPHDIFRKDN